MSAAAKKKQTAAKGIGSGKHRADTSTGNHGLYNRRYPWVLAVIGVFMLLLLLTDNWTFKLPTQFYFAAGTLLIFMATVVFKENRRLLSGRVSGVAAILTAQCALYFATLFYAVYPKFALQQFYLNAGALLIFTSAYAVLLRDEMNIKALTRLLSYVVAAASLISIELATGGLLLPVFRWLSGVTGGRIPAFFAAFETNTRITTTLGAPNVFAPVTVLGMFAALWNFGRPEERGKYAFVHLALAVVCGTAFVLCFSLGTILSYIVMLAAFVLVTRNEERGGQLARHLFCLVVSLIAASAVFALRSRALLPLLAVILIGAGAAFLYVRVRPFKLSALVVRLKRGIFFGIAAVGAVLILLCVFLRGAYPLEEGGTFRRAVAVKPGMYTLAVLFDGAPEDAAVTVEISSMSYAQAALKERTILSSVTLRSGEPSAFTVPEDAAAVFVSMRAGAGLRVTGAEITGDAVSKQLPLKYLLLPEFIVNRLQGYWVNDNAIQRFVFFRDGIRLGLKSPVFGLGGGAFEGGLYSVSDYYYQTRHSHNEYIERFAEGGIIGALLFIGLAVWIFRALYRARKSEKAGRMLPLLTAFMVMIFVHALLEVDFLFGSYRIVSALLFALTAAVCRDEVNLGRPGRAGIISAFSVVTAGVFMLTAGQFAAKKTLEANRTLPSLQTAVTLDPMNRDDYKLSYLLATMTSDKLQVVSTQEKYLASMTNDVNGLEARAQFFLLKNEPDYIRGIEAAEAYIRERRSDPHAWDMVFTLYHQALSASSGDAGAVSVISASIRDLCDYLAQLNVTLPKEIAPELAVFSYLRAAGLDAGSGDTVVDSRIFCDLNRDGSSDLAESIRGGAITWKVRVPMPGAYQLKLFQQESAACRITADGSPVIAAYDPAEGCFTAVISGTDASTSVLTVTTDADSDDVYFLIDLTQ